MMYYGICAPPKQSESGVDIPASELPVTGQPLAVTRPTRRISLEEHRLDPAITDLRAWAREEAVLGVVQPEVVEATRINASELLRLGTGKAA